VNDELKVVTTGSGSIGSLEPGWSVEEFSTPANPNEAAGGTGAVSFTGVDEGEGVLLINNRSVASSVQLGSISGVIRNASKTGQRIVCSQDTLLAQYDVTRVMPPMLAASVPGAIDLADQVLKTNLRFTGTTGNFWSMNGHVVGFDGEGNQVVQSSKNVNYKFYNNATAQFENRFITQNVSILSAETMSIIDGNTYAQNIVGDNFILESVAPPGTFYVGFTAPASKLDVQAKTMLQNADLTFTLIGQPYGPADQDYGFVVTGVIDYSAANIILRAEYRSGGDPDTVTTSTVSVASLNLNEELAFRFYFTKPQEFSVEPSLGAGFSVCNTSNYGAVVNCAIDFTPDLRQPLWFDPWTIQGNVRSLKYGEDLRSQVYERAWTASEWEQPVAYETVGVNTLGSPSVGFAGNVWQWLQNACTTYRSEIGLLNDKVLCRAVGSKKLNVTNVEGSPSIALSSTFTGRRVDVGYSNAVVASNDLVYDARADDNRIISVGVGQVTETAIQTDSFLTSIVQPRRVTTFIPGAGTYFVVDATGLPITTNQWEDFGGDLKVAISATGVGVIDVTFVGPDSQIPSTSAPYSVAVSDGTNQYGALSIIGSGVTANFKTLELLTGADATKTLQDLAFTITNPFIATLGQAFDSGVWATVEASGPRLSISLTVPTNSVEGFGLVQGSVFRYKDCDYRVTDASINRLSTSINAVRHVTVEAFDAAWNGKTVGEHDAVWDGYVCEDQKPLTFKGVN